MLILSIAVQMFLACQVDSRILFIKDGYAPRQILSSDSHDSASREEMIEEVSGSINQSIEFSDFFTRYPDYVSEGSIEWAEPGIDELEIEPFIVGNSLALKGGSPYICINEDGCLAYSEAEDGSSPGHYYSSGTPVWVIGRQKDWLLCVTSFSDQLFEDIPFSLTCCWIKNTDVLPLPVGIWGGYYGESIEAGHMLMITDGREVVFVNRKVKQKGSKK